MKNLYIPLITFFVFTFSHAQIGFQEHIVLTNTDNPSCVYPIDIDGDGDLDLISSSGNDDKIAWYENLDGHGNFGPQQIISTSANNPYDTYAADLDGDGDMDVLSASGQDNKIAWYKNLDGLGTFGEQLIITQLANGAYDVHAADIDNDGDIDVLSASPYIDEVAWYENLDGLGNFGPPQTINANAEFVQSVKTSDVDGDGDIDILFASPNDHKVAWHENLDGNGNFGPQQIITLSTNVPNRIYPADLDNDGDIDVAIASSSDHRISWCENTDGLGSYGPLRTISTSAGVARSVFAADLDGDNDLDILSASFLDDKIAWYKNIDGQGNFGPQQNISLSADAANTVFAADIDNDGDIDVLSASGFDDKISWYENLGILSVYANQPSDLVICDDDNDGFAEFDLTVTETEIIGGQDPTNLVITFYITQIDAENNINAIAFPSSFYNSLNPQTIYARLEDLTNGEFDTTSFQLIVNNSPVPVSPTPLIACDVDNDGFAEFTLTDKDMEIIGGEPGVMISYHETLLDAEFGLFSLTSPYVNVITPIQTIYVRVESYLPLGTGCVTIVGLDLIVQPTPEINPVTDLVIFDENNDGFEIFDLTTKIPEILNGQNDIEVTFYETQQDANDNVNAIANTETYQNSSNPQTIFTRLENLESSCYAVGNFVIFADPDLGITQNLLEDITIYPNPTKGILNVVANGLIIEDIKIINLQGIVLKNTSHKKEMDVSNLATGAYFIQLSVEGKTVTKKFIKN